MMTDFLITEMTLYPWFTWLLVFFAAMGLGYAAVWAYRVQAAGYAWLGYRRLVWRSKAAVRRHVAEGGCPSCAGPDDPEAVKAADLASYDRALEARCPLCGALPGERCADLETSRRSNLTHGVRSLAWAEKFRDDPPEYRHPDGDDDELPPEPHENEVMAFLHAVRDMGLFDDDLLPDGPPAEPPDREVPRSRAELVQEILSVPGRCNDPECDKYGWVHPPPCLILPTMPVPKYTAGPAMPPQPVRDFLHPAIRADLEAAGFSDHETNEGAADSMFTRAQAKEVQAMVSDSIMESFRRPAAETITDGIIPTE